MLKYVKTRQILTKRLSTVWELKTVKKKHFPLVPAFIRIILLIKSSCTQRGITP